MPELPEVETIVGKLRRGEAVERGLPAYPPLVGRVIIRAWSDWPRGAHPSASAIRRRLPGHRIASIGRRGKYLVFGLSPRPNFLLIHLKMSGRLDVLKADSPREKHVHFAFRLDNGYELRLNDARKFGRVYLVGDPNEVTGTLGPEPLDESFTLRTWRRLIEKKSGALKPLLLDQAFIAGIGNIYADEALWQARLHPRRRAGSLRAAEVAALYRGIRTALADGIRHEGADVFHD